MLLLTGVIADIETRKASDRDGREFESHTLVLENGPHRHFARVTRDFGPLPAKGDAVAVECFVTTFRRSEGRDPGYALMALRLNSPVAAVVFSPAPVSRVA